MSDRYRYSGRTGFVYKGGSFDTSSNTTWQEAALGDDDVSAFQGPVGATFAVAAPRIYLKSSLIKGSNVKEQ